MLLHQPGADAPRRGHLLDLHSGVGGDRPGGGDGGEKDGSLGNLLGTGFGAGFGGWRGRLGGQGLGLVGGLARRGGHVER